MKKLLLCENPVKTMSLCYAHMKSISIPTFEAPQSRIEI